MKRIYLDNAASTPMDPEVLEHMVPLMRDFYGNPSSVHHHGRRLKAIIERSRKTIAEYLGTSPAEIFFTSGGTEADNTAIHCTVAGLGISHIISSEIEHKAVLNPILDLEKAGKVKVTLIPVDGAGNPDLEALEEALANNPRSLVSLMHANNEIGTLIDIQAVGAICERYDAIFHTDTVQAMTKFKYNLAESKVHFLTGSAHKFYGPRGIGFLYMKAGTKIPPFIRGGGQERNMRAGTENVVSISGMAFAFKKWYDDYEANMGKLWDLKNHMKERLLASFPGIVFNGETERHNSVPTILNVSFPSDEQESMLLFNLDINGISASGGSACASGSVNASHVLAGIGASAVRSANSVRFSFGTQNTKEEIDFVMQKLNEFVTPLVNS